MDGFHTYGWMVNKLGLNGGDLTAFALIYGFVQGHAGKYLGGTAYLSTWTGWSEKTSRAHLDNLVSLGLLVKERGRENNAPFCHYKLAPEFYEKYAVKTSITGGKNFRQEAVKTSVKRGKKLPPRIEYIDKNIENNNTPHIITPHFNFRGALIALGVTAEVADAWMQVRKAKKAVNTEIAFRSVQREIEKAGRPADECIRIAVERSWSGFRADWLHEKEASPRPLPKKVANEDYDFKQFYK